MRRRNRRLLTEVRRHGWLQDYQYNLDHGPDRRVKDDNDDDDVDDRKKQSSPVNITININLGDIIDKLTSGKATAKEALSEVEQYRQERKRQLNECES